MSTINDFKLKDNCIVVQQNNDAGDAPQETSFACLALNDVATFKLAYSKFEVADGVIVRDKQMYDDPSDISRDQLDPVLVMLGQAGMISELKEHFITQLKNYLRYPNNDIPAPNEFFAIMIRAMQIKLLYVFLPLTDLFLCLSSLMFIFTFNPNDTDDDNHILRLYQSELRGTTIFSKLAIKLYIWFRKANNGNTIKGETLPIMGALAWKHRTESDGNPAMVEVWRPIVSKWYN